MFVTGWAEPLCSQWFFVSAVRVGTHLPAGRPAVVEKENPGRPESNRLEKQMWWWNSISGRGKVFIGPGLEICPLTEECSSLGWLGVFLHHGKDSAMIQHCCLSWTSRPCCVAELTSVCFFPQNPPNCWFSHSQCSNHLSDDFSFFTAEWLTVSLATAEACHKWNTLRIFYLLKGWRTNKGKVQTCTWDIFWVLSLVFWPHPLSLVSVYAAWTV